MTCKARQSSLFRCKPCNFSHRSSIDIHVTENDCLLQVQLFGGATDPDSERRSHLKTGWEFINFWVSKANQQKRGVVIINQIQQWFLVGQLLPSNLSFKWLPKTTSSFKTKSFTWRDLLLYICNTYTKSWCQTTSWDHVYNFNAMLQCLLSKWLTINPYGIR